MIEPVNVVKQEYDAISRRHRLYCALNGKTVNDPCLGQIACTEATASSFFWNAFHQVIERDNCQGAFAQMHENRIDGQAMQPSAEDGVASKRCKLAVYLQKGVLRQVFSEREIAHHAQTDREDVLFILCVQLRKCVFIANLGTADSIRLSELGVSLAGCEIRRSGVC